MKRPEDHPARPASYEGNEGFWQRRGYQPTGMQCSFEWRDLGESAPSRKPLRFWMRDLQG